MLCVHVFQVGIKGMAWFPSKSFALKTSSPFSSRILISSWRFLNQYHQLALGTSFQNGVGMVYVTSRTFNFSCCKVIHNLVVYMFKTQVTIFASSCLLVHLGVPLLVLPLRWSKSEVNGTFQYMATFHKEICALSTTSMAFLDVDLSIWHA
jgi:hypothetical protein